MMKYVKFPKNPIKDVGGVLDTSFTNCKGCNYVRNNWVKCTSKHNALGFRLSTVQTANKEKGNDSAYIKEKQEENLQNFRSIRQKMLGVLGSEFKMIMNAL